MNTQDIIAEAKKRLAELDAEADKLRRMIAAAEGTHVAPYPRDFPWTLTEGGGVVITGTALEIKTAPNTLYGSWPSLLGSSIVGDLVTTTGIAITGSGYGSEGLCLSAEPETQGGVRWREPATRYTA